MVNDGQWLMMDYGGRLTMVENGQLWALDSFSFQFCLFFCYYYLSSQIYNLHYISAGIDSGADGFDQKA